VAVFWIRLAKCRTADDSRPSYGEAAQHLPSQIIDLTCYVKPRTNRYKRMIARRDSNQELTITIGSDSSGPRALSRSRWVSNAERDSFSSTCGWWRPELAWVLAWVMLLVKLRTWLGDRQCPISRQGPEGSFLARLFALDLLVKLTCELIRFDAGGCYRGLIP
jgi:hypothetical protein